MVCLACRYGACPGWRSCVHIKRSVQAVVFLEDMVEGHNHCYLEDMVEGHNDCVLQPYPQQNLEEHDAYPHMECKRPRNAPSVRSPRRPIVRVSIASKPCYISFHEKVQSECGGRTTVLQPASSEYYPHPGRKFQMVAVEIASDSAGRVRLDMQPGVISAILFLFLDLLLIAALDRTLELFLNWYYYWRMRNGKVLRLRRADIPMLTNYLLDKVYLPGNLLALVVKSGAIAIIFLINLDIQSIVVPTSRTTSRKAIFLLDPTPFSGKEWPFYTVPRMEYEIGDCVVAKKEVVTYYQIAFNLQDGVFLEHDRGERPLNRTYQYKPLLNTTLCLSPEYVLEPIPFANVSGCSRVTTADCGAWLHFPKTQTSRSWQQSRTTIAVPPTISSILTKTKSTKFGLSSKTYDSPA